MVVQWGMRASKLVVAALVSLAQPIRVKAALRAKLTPPGRGKRPPTDEEPTGANSDHRHPRHARPLRKARRAGESALPTRPARIAR